MSIESKINLVIQNAISVESELKKLSSFEKYEALNFIAQQIQRKKEELALLIVEEAKKPLQFALAEIERTIQTFTIAAEESKRLPHEYISLDWTSAGREKEGFVKAFPIGIVLGITPFNFPFNLVAHKVAPAIAAGCPIIIKPSPKTPKCAFALLDIFHDTNLPLNSFQVIELEIDEMNHLINQEKIKLISFTGSDEVGWQIKANAQKKKITLELGGNASAIICPSANIENAVEKCVSGSFAYSGQVCIHTQKIYVHFSIFDVFLDLFLKRTKKLKRGIPSEIETDIAELINEESAIRIENWLNESLNNGAEILLGGKRDINYFEPTIITRVNPIDKISCKEIFGPVVILEKYTDLKNTIDLINQSAYGLQASLFSDSETEIKFAFENLACGGIMINESTTFRVDHMPYGGIKDSGIGREGVKYAIQDMMEMKILVK